MREIYPLSVLSLLVFPEKGGERGSYWSQPAALLSGGTLDWFHGSLFVSLSLKMNPLWSSAPNSSYSSFARWLLCTGKKWHESNEPPVESNLPKHPVSSTVTLIIPGQGIAFLVFNPLFLIHGRIRGTLKTVRLGGSQIIKMEVTAQWLLLGKRGRLLSGEEKGTLSVCCVVT